MDAADLLIRKHCELLCALKTHKICHDCLDQSSGIYKKNQENDKALKLQDNQEKKRERIKRKVTARGLRTVPKAREGLNHRGEPSSRRYAIIPSRAVYCPDLSPNDLLLLCTLGLFVSRQGVSYPTYETIRNCSGLGATQVSASLKRLINQGMIRKLQPKWFPEQSSKWLTSRYQVLFSSNDPIPTDEELKASIPYATDSDEDIQPIKKPNEVIMETNDNLIGIERDLKAMSQTYGFTIQTDPQSISLLASRNINKDKINQAFRLYISRFGSLPITLAMLLERGCFE